MLHGCNICLCINHNFSKASTTESHKHINTGQLVYFKLERVYRLAVVVKLNLIRWLNKVGFPG